MITQETATLIFAAHREIEAAEKLLADLAEAQRFEPDKFAPALKDAFGRQRHIELGIPSGENGHRLYRVSPVLAVSVIKSHIEHSKARLTEANERARIELCGEAGIKPSAARPD